MRVIAGLMKSVFFSGGFSYRRMSSSCDKDLFLVLRYTHVETESNHYTLTPYEEYCYHIDNAMYLAGSEKKYYFSLVSTEKRAALHDFRSPLFSVYGGMYMNISSCKGLVLFDHRSTPEHLWNPWTNQFKAVPPSSSCVPRPCPYTSCYRGFGFDLKSRDYKIIRFLENDIGDVSCDPPFPPLQIGMYSLKNDSWKEISLYPTSPIFTSPFRSSWFGSESWKEIFDDPAHPSFTSDCLTMRNGFYANGCCHWTTLKDKLVSFDFANESFTCISLPNTGLFEFVTPFHSTKICGVESKYELVEFDGLLGVVVYVSSRMSSPRVLEEILDFDAEVWVLNDDKSSWTRKVEIHAAGEGEIYTMLGFGCDNHLMFHRFQRYAKRGPNQLMAYDVNAKQVKKFEIYAYDDYMEVLPYLDSNVDFNGK